MHPVAGDRFRAILFLLRVAEGTNRVLLINWKSPTALEEFMVPNDLDWRLDGLDLPSNESTHVAWPVLGEDQRVS